MNRRFAAFCWGLMTLLAIGIAAYGFAYVFVPEMASGSLKRKLTAVPLAAWSHILGGGLALLLGAFQVNATLRKRFLSWHRFSGKLYLIAVAFGGLGGLYLAFHAEGGLAASLGFGALAVVWLFTGIMAFVRIRRRDIAGHRSWMIRNYALTFAAVTLRIYLPLFLIGGISYIPAYQAIAWLCWIPNLIVAEWLVATGRKRASELDYTVMT